ncbi:30S ribosomal protein S12 methylthiotransferase RimO [Eshraghiella crossota]|uniref:Ribosomal protein uS12 methylthiotransferase RimO n=1 Tax=Eshraghiella crossota DSM 2876 TaxID=511680 RepID=D4RW49_9FIRM|nr:30S ribosomal protein S12 methylthiotransferase RimO [Butyrivibrio crossotus]EFF69666.1 ribosomal protein S12 methylthiotransferase RimO [Butyrivibrio crossotus DSM 2876]UWO49795.1 30S ribosomal protein S12 methylthiotransferase RimO [Butyrivibrio crossotus]
MKLLFISLGCDKNLVDSEMMMGLLHDRGYEFTDNEEEADIIVINTCGFINDAKEESINTILEMAKYKENNLKALIVAGCLVERYKNEILQELPEIDAIVGTTAFDKICDVVDDVLADKKHNELESINKMCRPDVKRIITTGGYYSYLKIAEGCDKHCTYCSIPMIRGAYRSVPMDELVKEAEYLADNGVKELIIVAQEITVYGKDLYGEKKLPELLHRLCKIPGIQWIRLLYCYPEEITDELIETIRTEKKICHYIDMPIQHASDKILKAMGRRTNNVELRNIISKLRKEIPDICLRTTLITGFPGETEEDHQILLDFIDEMEFDRLGVFTYSPEEDTKAASLDNQVDEEVKLCRKDEIMELQQEISMDKSERLVGKEIEVIIEGKASDEDVYVGRSYMDAPSVDGYVFINSEEELMSGDFAKVRIVKAMEYDLIGDLI